MFDFDGTLANTLPWLQSVFNDLADDHGFRRVMPSEYERFRNLHGLALLRELNLPVRKLPRVMNGMRRLMAEHRGQLELFPGIPKMLHRMAECGIRLAVVSSNSQENVERVLGPDNAALFAEFSCGASMFGKASKLRKVIRAMGVRHEEALYIGDEIRDAEAAREAGIDFGAVAWGQHTIEMLRAQEPALIFDDVAEIAEKLC